MSSEDTRGSVGAGHKHGGGTVSYNMQFLVKKILHMLDKMYKQIIKELTSPGLSW